MRHTAHGFFFHYSICIFYTNYNFTHSLNLNPLPHSMPPPFFPLKYLNILHLIFFQP